MEAIINFTDPIWEVLIRLSFNLMVLFVIIGLIYKHYSDKKDYVFSFFLMGILIFLVCVVLKGVELHLGMAFGLFAAFSIMRFRTKNVAVKEMSYLFTVVGISAINALIDFPHPIRGAIVLNLIVILTVLILEKFTQDVEKQEDGHVVEEEPLVQVLVLYNKMELLDPSKMGELISDISNQTNIQIEKISIKSIDLIKGSAELFVFHKAAR